ncbi:MAG: VOC family protein [Chloroflexota bacterium]
MTTTQKPAAAPIAGLKFNHVAFRVRDFQASIDWYARAFGATEAFRATKDDGSPQLVYLEMTHGQFIELFPDGKNPIETPKDPIGYGHFCVTVDDLDAALAHLGKLGIEPTMAPRTGRGGQRLTFIADPDGNRTELMEIPSGSPIHRA